jgi:hypothetical protein
MSTPSWLRRLIASWRINIIGLPAAMSTPSLAATALIMASWEVKIICSPAMSTPSWLRPLIASWKVKIIGSPAVMSTPSLAATADGAQGHKNYSLAFDVYALVAATANGELENKHYLLACDVCALVGRDCHLACRLH